jgi:concanavalin A-like lectin/glucanase superfamily protein/uncharacterized protein DUF1565
LDLQQFVSSHYRWGHKHLACSLFLLILLGQFASAATYYVATTGSDSNPGTSSAPFRHLSKAALTATQPGDTVIVADGTYDNEGVVSPGYVVTLYYSGTAGNPITFKAQNRGKAILDSMNTSTTATCNGAYAYINLYNASFIVIQGFVIQRGCNEGIHSNDSAHDISIKWNEIRNIANHTATDQIGRDGIYINNTEYNFTFDGNSWHDIGRTDGITPMHFDHGIYSHAQNVTITNNVFYNMTRGWSIQLADGASNWLIANNTFAFPDTSDGEAGQIMFWGNNPNITLRNNIFYEPNSSAMTQYAATITGCVFDHNIVYGVSTVLSGGGCSVGVNQIGANPNFVNASSAPYDFRVQAGGPGIDAGVNLAAVPIDFFGTTRPQGSSTDVGMYEYASGTVTNPPVISGVFTSGISGTSAIVNWSTDQPSTSYANYGLLNYTNTTPVDSTLVTQHSVTISNLLASTLYHFQVGSTNSGGSATLASDSTFTTAVDPPASSTIALSAGSTTLSVAPGQSVTDAITATLVTGSAIAASFSASPLPAGVTAAFSSPSCTATCSTTLTLSASAAAAAGSYSVAVTGAGSGTSSSITIALTVSGSGTADITTGLAARWRFTEGSGNTALDSSGNGNNATLYNPTWWNSNYGMTAWFSGTNSYGSVKESASLDMTTQLTVSFWLRPSTNSNTDPRVISKLYDWDVKLNGSNRYPQFSAGAQYATLNYALPLITWHHVVFTFSTGVLKGYVDGVQVPFLANTFTGTETLAPYLYGLNLATDSSMTNSYIGSLDDVRLYNRALSPTDVAALYSALQPVNSGGSKKH